MSRHSASDSRDSLQAVEERLAFDELHDDVRPAVVLADFVDRADVRMIERGHGARLAQHAPLGSGSRPTLSGRILMATRRPSVLVVGEIDLAHPARSDERDDAVVAEDLRNAFAHRRMLPYLRVLVPYCNAP